VGLSVEESSRGEVTDRETVGVEGLTAWLPVLAFLGMVAHGLAQTITGPVVHEIMVDFAIRETSVGVLLAAGALGFMAGCFVGGLVCDRIGLKPLMLASWVGVTVALLGCANSPSYIVLLVSYACLGLASGCVEAALNVLPTQIGGGAMLMNLVHGGYCIGALVAPLYAGTLLERGQGWRAVYGFSAALPAILLALGIGTAVPESSLNRVEGRSRYSLLALVRHPLVFLGAIVLLFYVAAEIGLSAWIVLYVRQRFGLSPVRAGIGLSAFWLAILVGRLVQGFLARHVTLPGLIVAGGALGALGVAGVALASDVRVGLVAVFLAGLGASGIYPNVMALTNGRFPGQVGAVTGVLSTVAVTGSFIFQPLVGRIGEVYSLKVSFLGLAGCMVLLVLVYLPVWLGRVRA